MKKSAMNVFRRLPDPVRRAIIHAAMPSYTVGAVAILRRSDGRIAFVDQRHSNGWALPGGLVARGEHPAAALVRELREEVGLEIDRASLPVPFASVNSDVRRADVVFCFDVPPEALIETDDVEVLRTGWFALDALPELTRATYDILCDIRLL